MVTIIATTLNNKRDLLKTTIEDKFSTTCSSTTIKGLLTELNNLVPTSTSNTLSFTSNDTVSSKINKVATYLTSILTTNNVTASINDGFTTLINKIENIPTIITPTIKLETNKNTLNNGGTITLTTTVTGNSLNGVPTGKVEIYENNATIPLLTIKSSINPTTTSSQYTATISKNLNSTTSYVYYAKFISDDTSKYTDTEKSEPVGVSWIYTAPSKQNSSVTISANPSTANYGDYITVSASGKGTINIGTTSGGSDIATGTETANGIYIANTIGNVTFYATSTGDNNYYGASNNTTITVNKASSSTSLAFSTTTPELGDTVTIVAYGKGTINIGTGTGASDLGTVTNGGSVLFSPVRTGTNNIYAKSTGDDYYNGNSTISSLTVSKRTSKFANATSKISKNGSWIAYLYDKSNNPISGQHVIVKATATPNTTTYTKEYDIITDLTGKFTIDMNYDWPTTTITLDCSYSGNDYYKNCTATFKPTYN